MHPGAVERSFFVTYENGAMKHSEKLEVWSISTDDFPRDAPIREQLGFVLRYAVLAPSPNNSQPWMFAIDDAGIEFYADRSRGLRMADPRGRELVMSCGAALFNLRLALRRFGFADEVSLFPERDTPELLARIIVAEAKPASDEELELFAAVTRRRTHRGAFLPAPIDGATIARARAAAVRERCLLVPLDGGPKRQAVDLIGKAERIQYDSQSYRDEVARWIVPNRSVRGDGIPRYALGMNPVASLAFAYALRTIDVGRYMADRDQSLAETSPFLGVLATRVDDRLAWLQAGQALQRVLLTSSAAGLSASLLNHPVQVASIRRALATILEPRSCVPQAVIRLGFGRRVRPTPRRGLSDVCYGVAPSSSAS